MIEVREYLAETGRSPFAAWFRKLDRHAAERVAEALQRMRLGNLGDHKAVGQGLFERRIPFGPGLRVYFGKDGDRLVILVGGSTKQRQAEAIAAA